MSEIRPEELPLELLERIDAACDAFEQAWIENGRPRVEDYLAPVPQAARSRLTAELIRLEMEQRWRHGERPTVDEYRRRFPDCAESVAGWLDEARAAAERAASAEKETDYSRILPTLDGPPIPPTIGQPSRLLGEYELLERLGSGGMGEVYKARHRRLDKLVALKVLPADAKHPCEAAARFQREMKAIGALDHPNVVEAHDAGEHSGVVYLAMKLIDGVDLERLVKQRGPLPIAEACELVRQAALGLHYLHQRGLVHRDVKPSNLMRTPDGMVKVLDLGLARWCVEAEAGHALTGTGRWMGTPDFLAPEQLHDAASAEARADLYGLGGTLFFLLTGRAPFAHHNSLYAKQAAHCSESPPDVRTLRPEVPAELAVLLHRLLAKKPEERLSTAAEVAAALAPFTGVLPPSNSFPLPALPATKEAKPRKPRWPWLAGAAGVLTLAGIVLLLTLGRHPHEPSTTPSPSVIKPSGPIHVMKLDVQLRRDANDRGLPAGLLGEKVFDPHLGDAVTVRARLTRPAYAFLIAFRPDGKADVCFPETENEPPALTDQLSYPPRGKEVEYGLTDGTGLQAFAVVVSSQPLPPFKNWWPRREGCPWKKEEAPTGVVYRANGEDPVEAWSADGEVRGKGVPVKGKTPLARLAAWLRESPEVETVQVLGFVVEVKQKR